MRVHQRRQAERLGQVELARRGVEQVVAAHDLADALGGVVGYDRQVAGRSLGVAAHDEVVDHALDVPVQAVLERDPRRVARGS